MTDITITHKIVAPELAAAINNLADTLKNRPVTAPAAPVAASAMPAKQTTLPPAEKPVEAPTNAPVTDAVNSGAAVPTSAPTPAPIEAPAANATPAEKVYTFDDITNAGAQLLEAGKMQELMKLLKEGYGVQAVTQLKSEQYAAVAADLRKLGANI